MTAWSPESCTRLAEVAGETLRPGGLELTKYLLSCGNLPAGSRILDAGCGLGLTTQYLRNTLQLAAVGVDSSEEMLAAARLRTGDIPLICSELENLPFEAARFDAVLCECVLSQTRTGEVLAEFQRVLHVNGLLLISDLYLKSALPDHGPDAEPVAGLATRAQVTAMMADAGFTVEHWEERTRELQLLAARLILAPGSSGENLFGWKKKGCFLNKAGEVIDGRNVGYYLLVARRIE